ncbi:hypothetical protein [Bogoriella caseilytica]|uniref:hypothetical protein n=1 Tax=Bogoriella caseilytica TaxID=56055 RepID=UPI000F463BD2|nr:hypothetical protein [Bogoriella caseilytica]
MKSVRLLDFIEFDGDSWQVTGQDGATTTLKSLTTAGVREVPLATLLGDGSFVPDSPDRLPNLTDARVLDTLPQDERARVEWLHQHVHEVLTGSPPSAADGDVVIRPEYGPGLRLQDRMAAKLA